MHTPLHMGAPHGHLMQTGPASRVGSIQALAGEMMLRVVVAFIAICCGPPLLGRTIRDVDFRNFTYTIADRTITLSEGKGRAEDPNDPSVVTEVTRIDVTYGDLTGDSSDEAVVVLGFRMGGTGYFTTGYVFANDDQIPSRVATFAGGDRAIGGIVTATVENLQLLVERNEGSCSTCVTSIVTTRYRLQDGRLIVVGTSRQSPADSAAAPVSD